MINHYTVITLNAPPPYLGKRIIEAHYTALRISKANHDKPEEAQKLILRPSNGTSRPEGRESVQA